MANPNSNYQKKNDFVAEVKLSNKTKDAIINDEVAKSVVDEVKAKAQEMVKALTEQGKATNATVKVNGYTTKDGAEGISRQISFSGKDAKDAPLQTLTLSLNAKLDVTYSQVASFDAKTKKPTEVKFADNNNRIKGIREALEKAGFMKAYEKVNISPVQNVVNKFMHEVAEYNKANPDNRIILGHGVYNDAGEKVLDTDGRPKWKNFDEITRKDGSTIASIMLRQNDDRIQIRVEQDGQISAANYLNRTSYDEGQNRYTDTAYTYDLNRWADNKEFAFSSVLKGVIDALEYTAPERPAKDAEAQKNEDGFINFSNDLEEVLPFADLEQEAEEERY